MHYRFDEKNTACTQCDHLRVSDPNKTGKEYWCYYEASGRNFGSIDGCRWFVKKVEQYEND